MKSTLKILLLLISSFISSYSFSQTNNDHEKIKEDNFFYLTLNNSDVNESFISNAKKHTGVKDISIIENQNSKTTIKVFVNDDIHESTEYVQSFCIKNGIKTVFVGKKEIASNQIINFLKANPNYAAENRQIEH